ncbi:MAG: carbamoyltransferase C-terminal domain-containing protein [Bryobacteraceae bacterium]
MLILGIGGVLRSASAAVLRDGQILAAIEEDKLNREHRSGELPLASILECLRISAAAPAQVDYVAITRPVSPGGTQLQPQLRALFPAARMIVVDHHAAHAAAAYFASPFDSASVLTLDRSGDFRCGARWRASGNHLYLEQELYYPDSLGDLYGRVTELLGFQSRADEHKVQWLSTAGDARYRELFLEILGAGGTRGMRLDASFFASDRVTQGGFGSKFFSRLGLDDGSAIPPTLRESLAAGLQQAMEHAVLEFAGEGDAVCLGGGIAFNALLVAALERSGRFKGVFVQPNGGNAGNALGALYHAWNVVLGESSRPSIGNFCLGPSFTAEEIKQVLENCKLRFRYLLTTDELVEAAVSELSENKIVAWMHGRMEFGPRALGNRSILASPLDPYSTENLNAYIKHREQFRKFAASVPAEIANEYFEVGSNARFLATVSKVRPAHRATFQAALLGEDWIRVHAVSEEDNPLYWRLLHAAGKRTGLPVLYNTSFNLFGYPLVCSPRDAVRSFYSSGIDTMFVGGFLLQK